MTALHTTNISGNRIVIGDDNILPMVSICCTGDDITSGKSCPTYRKYLPELLANQGFDVRWRGSQVFPESGTTNPCIALDGADPISASDNYWKQASAHLGKSIADIVLVHSGHNMDSTGMTPEQIISEIINPQMYDSHPPYEQEVGHNPKGIVPYIKSIRTRDQDFYGYQEGNEKVIILLAQVIPSELPKYGYIPQWNKEILKVCQTQSQQDSPVIPVNMADGWDVSIHCGSDGIHPNEDGAKFMAQKWCDAICSIRDRIVNLPRNSM